MPLLLLIRHGENDLVKTGKMAGKLPGVHLNEQDQKQAQALPATLIFFFQQFPVIDELRPKSFASAKIRL